MVRYSNELAGGSLAAMLQHPQQADFAGNGSNNGSVRLMASCNILINNNKLIVQF
jgi:hypothetical protein